MLGETMRELDRFKKIRLAGFNDKYPFTITGIGFKLSIAVSVMESLIYRKVDSTVCNSVGVSVLTTIRDFR
jgi:hypothetical protein